MYDTDATLAEKFGVPEWKVAAWRLRYGWPHMKVGRVVRYTEADVAAIERMHHVEPEAEQARALPGQTPRSAARN